MKRSVLLLMGTMMVVMFQNCAQNVSFKTEDGVAIGASTGGDSDPNSGGGSDGDDVATPSPTPDSNMPEYNEQFKVTFSSESAPMDMVWVIDNSGSMSQEAAAVRKNFDAFLTVLNKTTNFRLLLLSATTASSPNYGVTIPSTFDPAKHLQIDFAVGSTNGPALLLEKLKIVPAGFFRTESKKIIVFVTDDNSNLEASSFMTTLLANQSWNARDVSVSSFIALDPTTSPCIAREGVVYKNLAAQTNGRYYNICLADWSASFSDLINSSVSKAIRRFVITTELAVKEILEVKVDGVVISKSLYSLDGKAVTLSDSVSLSENSQVVIRYR